MNQAALSFGEPRDVLRSRLVTVLAMDHQGRAHGIGARALAGKLGVAERMLRHLVSDAREQGIAIVGTPDTGYFIARTGAELDECCRFLRSRAMHSLAIEARLRKVALPELLGQLRVNT